MVPFISHLLTFLVILLYDSVLQDMIIFFFFLFFFFGLFEWEWIKFHFDGFLYFSEAIDMFKINLSVSKTEVKKVQIVKKTYSLLLNFLFRLKLKYSNLNLLNKFWGICTYLFSICWAKDGLVFALYIHTK